jgi:hypothetical protein
MLPNLAPSPWLESLLSFSAMLMSASSSSNPLCIVAPAVPGRFSTTALRRELDVLSRARRGQTAAWGEMTAKATGGVLLGRRTYLDLLEPALQSWKSRQSRQS